jgi:tetratricopeptide (TPR) repeat protein
LGRDEEALVAFDYALALNAQYSAAWNNKGLSLFTLGHLDEALAAFDQATSFAPNEPDAWYNKAIVLERLARTDEALSCQARAIRLEHQTT